MLIRHLRFFVRLAEEQHFGRAAERCNVTQPTLSQAIRKLESDLDLVLIVRGHRFLSLTPEGEKVLLWGRQILADYDNLRGDLNGTRAGGLTGTLRLGVIPAAMPVISLLSERFSTLHPEARIEVRSMTSRAIEKALETFSIDGGMTYLDNEPLAHVRGFPLYHERYVFACRPDHPLAASDTVGWAEANAAPLCLLSDEMQNRRILDEIAARAGVVLTPRIVSNTFLGIASHLRAGRWGAIIPHTFGYLFGDREIVLRRMEGPAHSQTLGLVLPERTPQSPMAQALQDWARRKETAREFELTFGLGEEDLSEADNPAPRGRAAHRLRPVPAAGGSRSLSHSS
ncbi:LysR family transcriptional regulator [Paracoccus aminophilus]|uniref:Transcriptional regulator, LysR family n=1 Tax=Paracoccus aminophilus JCM 7686 TaxID=1367847 RepID=S5YVD6_PARAH|nr:LysR family transcriptional regulator [Paracoccus aminophilus]AGT09171.1 transcriptional regulator, LysR family [Paracoccus aminophilus JCM 7686]